MFKQEDKEIFYRGEGYIISSTLCIDELNFSMHIYPTTSGYSFTFTNSDPIYKPILSFFFSESYLLKFRGAFPVMGSLSNNEGSITPYLSDPEMTILITKIMNCRFSSEAAIIWYDAKVLELLTLALDRVTSTHNATMKLSKYNVEMLHKAREILVSDFENIPTIKQLARKVGTNDFNLKRGFKQLFGNSIFAYVQTVRLERARELLKETDYSITDIAYMTGYDHCNNFSVAFKRKFGMGPKFFRK